MEDVTYSETQDDLSRLLKENAAAERQPIYPLGGGTAWQYGYPRTAPGKTVSLTEINQTIDYPARDMTVTVEAGIRMCELGNLLASENQRLPIDIPHADQSTLGGVIATNWSGSRRFGCGSMRDYLIGVTAVDASGRFFHAGGRVVKNVAGYDLCKLLVGSLGTLGVITEATLKLRPIPESTAVLWSSFESYEALDHALDRLTLSQARPVALDIFDSVAAGDVNSAMPIDLPADRPVLCVGVEGIAREVDWQVSTLEGELARNSVKEVVTCRNDRADSLWQSMTNYVTNVESPLVFRANLLPSKTIPFINEACASGFSIQSHAGNGIVLGHFRHELPSADEVMSILSKLRETAVQASGNLTVLSCPDDWKSSLELFGEPTDAWPLMKKIKANLDPHGLLNPGRFFDGNMPSEITGQH